MNKSESSKSKTELSVPINQFFIKIIRRGLRLIFLCITQPNKIIEFINRKRQSVYKSQLNQLWSQQTYILAQLPKVDTEYYKSNNNIVELEHQVGRYLNMKDIITEIKKENIEGDILEFGTWQGLGLLILNLCFGDHNRKLIGN
jgi:hypothetical protein